MTDSSEFTSPNDALLHYLERIAVALEDINEKLDELVLLEEEFDMDDFEIPEDEDWDDEDEDEDEQAGDSPPSKGGEQFNFTGRTIYDTNDPADLGSDKH